MKLSDLAIVNLIANLTLANSEGNLVMTLRFHTVMGKTVIFEELSSTKCNIFPMLSV